MSGMWQQVMGMYSKQYRMRFDTTAIGFNLVYPERPLISNLAEELLDLGSYAMGQNANLATGTWQGAGQDDSLIMNASSLALGLGLAMSLATCTDEERSYGISSTGGVGGASARINGDRFCKATSLHCQALRDATYEHIDEDGLPLVGSMIPKERAVVFSKVLPRQKMSSESGDMSIVNESQYVANQEQCQVTHHDKSTVSSQKHSGYVDACIVTTNHKNAKISKLHFMKLLRGSIGDKWSTRHGQKNTCGAIYPEWLMPYDHLGVRVDVSKTKTPNAHSRAHALCCFFLQSLFLLCGALLAFLVFFFNVVTSVITVAPSIHIDITGSFGFSDSIISIIKFQCHVVGQSVLPTCTHIDKFLLLTRVVHIDPGGRASLSYFPAALHRVRLHRSLSKSHSYPVNILGDFFENAYEFRMLLLQQCVLVRHQWRGAYLCKLAQRPKVVTETAMDHRGTVRQILEVVSWFVGASCSANLVRDFEKSKYQRIHLCGWNQRCVWHRRMAGVFASCPQLPLA